MLTVPFLSGTSCSSAPKMIQSDLAFKAEATTGEGSIWHPDRNTLFWVDIEGKTLYEYYMKHTNELPKFFVELGLRGEPREKVVCDYISSMTDRFAIALYDELYVPKFWMG